MSELQDRAASIESKLDAEAVQGAELTALVVELRATINSLVNDTYAKDAVNAILDKIDAKIPGIVPDAPAPDPEPEVPVE